VLKTLHMDHINSALHMAVTLNGRRTVGFARESCTSESDFLLLGMKKGGVYVTTPASILHGISVPDLDEDDRSVALQCRSLLSVEDADFWYEKVHCEILFQSVTQALESYGEQFIMPTLEQYNEFYNQRVSNLSREKLPDIDYTNIFNTYG